MFTLPELQAVAESGLPALDACLLPIEHGLSTWPKLVLDPPHAARLGHGQAVRVDPGDTPPGLVAVFDHDARVLGLARLDEAGVVRVQRLFRWAAAADAGSRKDDYGPAAASAECPEAT